MKQTEVASKILNYRSHHKLNHIMGKTTLLVNRTQFRHTLCCQYLAHAGSSPSMGSHALV